VNPDVAADLNQLSETLASVEAVSDLDGLRKQIADLEQQASRPDLWDDPESAQKVTSQLSHKQSELRRVEELRQRLDDLSVLYELAEEEGAAEETAEADEERAKLRTDIGSLEVRTLLSGEYDERDALVTIRS
jgi:peptide chain release factor 2